MRRFAPHTHQIVKVTAELAGEDKANSFALAREEVLKWLRARVGLLPGEAWAGETFEHMTPGRFAAGVSIDLEDGEYWCTRCDDPDKDIPARTWTTEMSLGRQGNLAIFGLRLVMATTEAEPAYTPSVPGVIRQLSETPGLLQHNRQVSAEPMVVDDDEKLRDLIWLLLDPRRRRPAYVISLDEGITDFSTAAIDYRNLARRCIGIAHVGVITGPMTYGLTDYLGKDLSTFHGAVRTYRPGITGEDDPYRHPLAFRQRIAQWQEVGPEAFVDLLVANAAASSIVAINDDGELPPFTRARQIGLQRSRQLRQEEGADTGSLLELALQELDEKQSEITDLQSLAVYEEQQRISAEQQLASVEGKNEWLRRRVIDLERALESAGRPVSEDALPRTYDELRDWADRTLPGRVHITPRAQRDAKDASFNDTELVYRCLQVLGHEYWQMRTQGGSEVQSKCYEAFRNLGVRNERTGQENLLREQGDTFVVPWGPRGEKRVLAWHLKNGGNTRDPERCLRIYYFWDDEPQQVVVGSLPGHLKTRAT
jgi:hypothetical protein